MTELSLEFYLISLVALSVVGGVVVGIVVWLGQRRPADPVETAATPAIKCDLSKDDLHETGVQLFNEAAAILKLVHSHMAAGDRFSNSLAEADLKLPQMDGNTDKVRALVKFLISENAKMQQEQTLLQQQLQTSQTQIDALRLHLAEAEEESLKDPLTGVANRRALDVNLQQAISEATSLKRPLCLLMCDLDHFKKLNDTYGHPVGDEILKIFGHILSENVRQGDTVARYGGEEFAIILTRCDTATAARIADRMRLDTAARKLALNRNGQIISNITASFGIAQFLASDTPESLLARADAKLYEAKKTGRNRIVIDKSALAA
jgi:diguanylate cyclase